MSNGHDTGFFYKAKRSFRQERFAIASMLLFSRILVTLSFADFKRRLMYDCLSQIKTIHGPPAALVGQRIITHTQTLYT